MNARLSCDDVSDADQRFEQLVSGASIDRAKRMLAEIERFEKDAD